jgi:hypothetical protein
MNTDFLFKIDCFYLGHRIAFSCRILLSDPILTPHHTWESGNRGASRWLRSNADMLHTLRQWYVRNKRPLPPVLPARLEFDLPAHAQLQFGNDRSDLEFPARA